MFLRFLAASILASYVDERILKRDVSLHPDLFLYQTRDTTSPKLSGGATFEMHELKLKRKLGQQQRLYKISNFHRTPCHCIIEATTTKERRVSTTF